MSAIRRISEAVRAQFEAMGERDRRIATIFLSVVALGAVIALTVGLRRVLADEASRVRVASESLVEVQEMVTELQGLQAKIAAAEGRMGRFHANQMNTYLEQWAQKAGVVDSLSVKPGQPSEAGSFQSVPYQVSIAKADLGALLTFLYQLETSPYPVRVRSARMKAEGPPQERTLRVDLEVVAYSKEEG